MGFLSFKKKKEVDDMDLDVPPAPPKMMAAAPSGDEAINEELVPPKAKSKMFKFSKFKKKEEEKHELPPLPGHDDLGKLPPLPEEHELPPLPGHDEKLPEMPPLPKAGEKKKMFSFLKRKKTPKGKEMPHVKEEPLEIPAVPEMHGAKAPELPPLPEEHELPPLPGHNDIPDVPPLPEEHGLPPLPDHKKIVPDVHPIHHEPKLPPLPGEHELPPLPGHEDIPDVPPLPKEQELPPLPEEHELPPIKEAPKVEHKLPPLKEKVEKPAMPVVGPAERFVTLDQFRLIQGDISGIKNDLKGIDEFFVRLEEEKSGIDHKYSEWQHSLQDIQRKIIFVDKTLFKEIV